MKKETQIKIENHLRGEGLGSIAEGYALNMPLDAQVIISLIEDFKTEKLDPIQRAIDFQTLRPILDENNQCWAGAITLLLGEVAEMEEEAANYHEGLVGKCELVSELADIALFAVSCIKALGHDPHRVLNRKIDRNIAKYPEKDFQEGDYYEKAKLAKQNWQPFKKDENEIYMKGTEL